MSAPRFLAVSWAVVRLSTGLGLLVGALEGAFIAGTARLETTFAEAALLSGAALAAGLGVAWPLAGVAGLVVGLWPGRALPLSRQATGLGLVALGLGLWYLAPLGIRMLGAGRIAAGLAGLALPFGIAGVVLLNARHWLRRAEVGLGVRPGWVSLAAGVSLLIALGDAALLTGRPRDPAPPPGGPGRSVLLVTLDTARRDHFSAYGDPGAPPTPRFDALAREGVLFTDAVTPTPETAPAHASLFTSLHPVRHGVLSNADVLSPGFLTLAERLRVAGWATGAFVSSFAVDSRTGLDQGFGVYDDDFWPTLHGATEIRLVEVGIRALFRFGDPLAVPFLLERSARDTHARAARWMAARTDRPFFCWVHYFEPHAPYEPHPGGPDSGGVDHRAILPREASFAYTPEVEARLRTLYRGEVAWTDARLGDLLDTLDALGLADRTLVAVLADHGEMLGEHGIRFRHHGLWEEVVRIPLALRAPGLEAMGSTVAVQTRIMDVPATLLAWLGRSPMDPGEGVDLGLFLRKERTTAPALLLAGRKAATLDRGSLYGLRTGRTADGRGSAVKYLLDRDLDTELLFDLVQDPKEVRDISASQPAAVATSRRFVMEEVSGLRAGGPPEDPFVRDVLQALGYLR